jgi:serine phosphatase RsbU (regulator of sigma subunit)/anti-sigma regulatory factor (Ser/Thr protein kinase)/transposase
MNFSDLLVRILSHLPLEPKRRTYRVEVAAKDIELLTIKDFVQRVCDAAGCNAKEISNIKLAIDEACSNIIRHAYDGKSDGKIVVEMGVSFIDLKIKIIDYGKSFDFQGVKDPDLNHYVDIGKKGGLGIWLIKKVMSRVVYKAYPDHNELILYRRLSKTPPKELGLVKGNATVSTKFIRWSMALGAVLILLSYLLLANRQTDFVIKQQRDNVNLVVQTIASQAGRSVVRKNDLELEGLIREVARQDSGKIITTLFIIGPDGKYLAHSDSRELFKTHKPAPGVRVVREPGVKSFRVKTVEGPMTDYVSAIFFQGKWVGEVHTGVSDAAVDRFLNKERSGLAWRVLLISMFGLLGLYLLSRIVIKPFQKILEGVHAISTGDLSAKIDVDSQDEFGQLANIFNEMTNRIQDSQKGMMEQERMQKEMQVAQEIQHTLLPAEFPQIEGYEIGATYRAAKEVGGDYYDFFWVDPTTMGIVVADVSGKGVPGSMVMTMIRTAMRLEARGNKSASEVLAKVNQHVTADIKKGMFVTMFYIILDSRNRSINFASAGHNPMILYRGGTDEVYFLKPKGFPVGIDLPEDDMFRKNMALQKVSLQKNDMLVIYTDGITEAMNTTQQQFGEERLVQVIKDNCHLTPGEFVEKLNESIAQFTQGAEQNDDITVVAIKEKMQAEQVQFKFRKKLIDLVETKGLSVAEACRQMNISPNTYYRYKKIFDEKGKAGLKPVKSAKRAILRELTLPQKRAVMLIIQEHPEYGARRITEALRKSTNPPMKIDSPLIYEFLKRKGLTGVKERKALAVNEVDSV